jgi:hypothetical protein
MLATKELALPMRLTIIQDIPYKYTLILPLFCGSLWCEDEDELELNCVIFRGNEKRRKKDWLFAFDYDSYDYSL